LRHIVYDAGEGDIAIALGEWDDANAFAMRWNGTEAKPNGNPFSRQPTWFILPDDFGFSIIKDLLLKQALGNDYIKQKGLGHAIDWMREIHKLKTKTHPQKY